MQGVDVGVGWVLGLGLGVGLGLGLSLGLVLGSVLGVPSVRVWALGAGKKGLGVRIQGGFGM